MDNEFELLSPAGNIDSFKAAVQNGADAIYMGVGKFNARQMIKNMSIDEYIDAITYAHIYGVKVYLTLNTLMLNSEIKEAILLLIQLYSHGLDGVILQDIGLAELVHKILPNINMHASTQMSVHSIEQVKYLEKLGFSRVVLARELSLEEIENICKNTSVEIEVFVHGALCVSYSGQCLMSSMIGGRSGNRGVCAGPCRMKYSLYQNGKLVEKSKYLLSKKDIFGLNYLDKLKKIGVKSFKIEGRSKTPEYVGLVTQIYRKYMDRNADADNYADAKNKDKQKLIQMFNRDGISSGYFEGVKHKESITINSPKNTGIYLGKVLEQRKEYVKLKLEQNIDLHDGIEINEIDSINNDAIVSTIVTCIKDQNFKTVNHEMKKGDIVWIGDINKKVKFDSNINKTSSFKLNEEVRKTYTIKQNMKRVNINLKLNILKDKKINVKVSSKNIDYTFDYIPQLAINKAIDYQYVENVFSKTMDSYFEFKNIKLNLDKGLFVPVAKLNELRRTLLELIYNSYVINIDVKDVLNVLDNKLKISDKNLLKTNESYNIQNALYIYQFDKEKLDNYIIKKDVNIIENKIKYSKIYINISDVINREKYIEDVIKQNLKVYICLPNIINHNVSEYIYNNLENLIKLKISGIVIGNVGYIDYILALKKKYNFEIIADYYLNITNTYSALFYKSQGFDTITISPELPNDEINNIAKYINVELIRSNVDVMTSRYCMIGSFIGYDKLTKKCLKPCIKNKYYILDTFGQKYQIICDFHDCIMKIVKPFEKEYNTTNICNLNTIRYNEIVE